MEEERSPEFRLGGSESPLVSRAAASRFWKSGEEVSIAPGGCLGFLVRLKRRLKRWRWWVQRGRRGWIGGWWREVARESRRLAEIGMGQLGEILVRRSRREGCVILIVESS